MEAIDARGLSCPQPVILLRQALDKKPAECRILVDNRTALENTTRYAENAGYHTSYTQEKSDFLLVASK